MKWIKRLLRLDWQRSGAITLKRGETYVLEHPARLGADAARNIRSSMQAMGVDCVVLEEGMKIAHSGRK